MKTGIELIALERHEQVVKHGRTINHDKLTNKNNELSEAASELISPVHDSVAQLDKKFDYMPFGWDENIWAKMWEKPYKERLIIAGALIAAEIDRLQAMGS